MYRGSTPKFKFTLPFNVEEIAEFVLTFEQGDKVILRKYIDDCELYTTFDPICCRTKNIVSCCLTAKESLMFEPARQLHIQMRALLEDNVQVVTRELTTYVYDTMYEGDLPIEDEEESL